MAITKFKGNKYCPNKTILWHGYAIACYFVTADIDLKWYAPPTNKMKVGWSLFKFLGS